MITVVLAVESEAALADLSVYPRGGTYEGVRLVDKGLAFDCALTLLESLTLDQLVALELSHMRQIKGAVALREQGAKAAAGALRDSITSTYGCRMGPHDEWAAFAPPEAGDQLRETDEDGDEVLDPTPIVTPVEMHRLADDGGPAH